MKAQRSIWLGLGVVALIGAIVWFCMFPAKKSEKIAMAPSSVASTTGRSNTKSIVSSNAVTIGPIQRPSRPSKDMQMVEELSTLNDVPIIFYGKIEDQFSNVLADTTVTFGVRVDNGTEATVKKGQVVSDANGLFTISGYKGESLGIGVKKEGYVFISMSGSGIYSKLWPEEQRAHPDPNSPVIIKMWKLKGAEPLMGIHNEYKIPFTNTLFFDFLMGKVSDDGGDLQVVITRAAGPMSKRNPGDWSIEFKPVDGGIIESDDATSRVTYEAPAEGYQSSFLVRMDRENPAWHDNVQKVFFLTSRKGRIYTKLAIDFGINDNPNGSMWFQFRGASNTNGSRNWEATAPQ